MKKCLLLIFVLSFVCLPAVAQYAQRYPLGSMVDHSDPLADGLVGWYRFVEGMGNMVWDSSGSDITGTLSGFAYHPLTLNSGWKPWKFGHTLLFEGVDDHIDLGGEVPWEYDSVGTITAWVTLDFTFASNYTRAILCASDSGDANSAIRFNVWNPSGGDNSAYLSLFCYESSSKKIQVRNAAVFPVDEWLFVAVVQDGIAIKMYIDTVEQTLVHSGTTDHGAWFDTITDIDFNAIGIIKVASTYTRQWDGFIDDLRVYNRPLTQSELTDLFLDHNRPLFPPGMGLSMSGAVRQGVAQVIMVD